MQDLEYIDDYFKGLLPPAEKARFEQRILQEPAFAETVSFYYTAMRTAGTRQSAGKERFRTLYEAYTPAARPSLVRQLLPYAAAAAVLVAVVLGWYLWMRPVPTQQLADNYIHEQLVSLGVKMDLGQDSLQTSLQLYNEGKLDEALARFESIQAAHPRGNDALKYAGIAALRLGEYDKALQYFQQLEQQLLYSNPGKFFHALTLMKRSAPGDRDRAKELLQQVVNDNLDRKQQAQQWLRKW